MPNKVRIDKWLWAVRLFKTRSMAANACKTGKVKVDGKNVKSSYMLETGIIVHIKKRERLWVVKSGKLIEKRVGASLAAECYEDLSQPPEPSDRLPSFFYRTNESRDQGSGRPTKKDRRRLDNFKDGN
jgi:ribosome-associated heat shock protein Hsp15